MRHSRSEQWSPLIPCIAAYIYTTLVSLLFGTVIPTSFNILMEMFLLPLYNIPVTVVSVFCIGEPSSRVDSGCAREISIPYAVFSW